MKHSNTTTSVPKKNSYKRLALGSWYCLSILQLSCDGFISKVSTHTHNRRRPKSTVAVAIRKSQDCCSYKCLSDVKVFQKRTILGAKVGIRKQEQPQQRQRRSRQPTTLFDLANPVSVSPFNPINDEINVSLSKVSRRELYYVLPTQSQVQSPISFINTKQTKTTSPTTKEQTLISNKHHNHKHHDTFEGAVYGLTTMLIVSYSAIFFLYNPDSMFSASELCWSTTNGYIFALISHFLRRNERIRLHHSLDSSLHMNDLPKSLPVVAVSSLKTPTQSRSTISNTCKVPSSLQTATTDTTDARLQAGKTFSYRSYSYKRSTTSPLKTEQETRKVDTSFFETLSIGIVKNSKIPAKITQSSTKYNTTPINNLIQKQSPRRKASSASLRVTPIATKDADFFIHLLRKFQNDTLQKTQKSTTKTTTKRTSS